MVTYDWMLASIMAPRDVTDTLKIWSAEMKTIALFITYMVNTQTLWQMRQ